MRLAVIPTVIVLALTLAACGASTEPEPASTASDAEEQALQERVDNLEREAAQRDAAAARKLKAARAKAKAAQRKARAAKREAERERAQAREEAEAAQVTDASAEQTGGGIVVPDVTGLDHQAAQDALQGEGLWVLDEKDCTGQGRMLLFDRNWEVVSTAPAAGSRVSEETTITICSKKQGE